MKGMTINLFLTGNYQDFFQNKSGIFSATLKRFISLEEIHLFNRDYFDIGYNGDDTCHF